MHIDGSMKGNTDVDIDVMHIELLAASIWYGFGNDHGEFWKGLLEVHVMAIINLVFARYRLEVEIEPL